MRTRYKILIGDTYYFITSTIVNWIPIFTNEKYYDILINAIKFYQNKKNIEIVAYVFLPEHFHMIAKSKELIKTIQLIKMFSAKEIVKQLKVDNKSQILSLLKQNKKEYKRNSDYQVWQEGFIPKEIMNDEMLNQKIEYIHYNPVKKGLVNEPFEWKYSSAYTYEKNEEGIIKLDLPK
ncbi:MAG TPA: transposase [Ignavibacteria bacterium]